MSSSRTLVTSPVERLAGTLAAPPSKSYTHRALLVAGLDGATRIRNPLSCEDTRHTVAILRKLGAKVKKDGRDLVVRGFNGRPRPTGNSVNVGESGTLLRFILSILSLTRGPVTVMGKGSILTRTNRQVVDVLRSWGVDIRGRGRNHTLPIDIDGRGSLTGGTAAVEAGVTSQVVSSLLIAAPFAANDTVLKLDGKLVSRPYVDITMDVLRRAGVKVERTGYRQFRVKHGQRVRPGKDFVVHGDYSSSAFLLAAAALVPSDVTVTDLVKDCQGDRRIIGILRKMGVNVRSDSTSVRVKGPAELRGVDVDCSDTPDLVPVLCALGCFARGRTRILNVAHLVHKESNRLARPAGELRKLGAKITVGRDHLAVHGSRLHGGAVSGCNDHRIAMALAVAGCRIPGKVRIRGAECIAKSYPRFVSDMKKLGAALNT